MQGNSGIKNSRRCHGIAATLVMASGLWLVLTPSQAAGQQDAAAPTHMAHAHHMHASAAPAQSGYVRREVRYTVPHLALRSAADDPVDIAELLREDKPVMLNFIFTSCTAICPVMTATFARVRAELGPERSELRMISVSIDPEHDTPSRLAEYAQRFRADKDWIFLTGTVPDIVGLQRAFDNYRGDKMNHQPITFMRISPDAPWVRVEGFTSARALIGEYRRLRKQ